MTECSCFDTECWNEYFADCCQCCCECNWRLILAVGSPCGSVGGTIHYTIDEGIEQTTTDFELIEYSEDHSICMWFEPDDPEESSSYELSCTNDPCGSCSHDAATCVEYTASTISFGSLCDGSYYCICDSANQFIAQGFEVGMRVCISGSTAFNNGEYCPIVSVTAGKICFDSVALGGGFCWFTNDEAAGASITVRGVLPDTCSTDICFEACGFLPTDADVTLNLNFGLNGSCVFGSDCFDSCNCFRLTSAKIGTCSGGGCVSLGDELLAEPVDLCFENTWSLGGITVTPATINSGFCLRLTTEWCECDYGCELIFEPEFDPFPLPIATIEFTGGDTIFSYAYFNIFFLSSGDPPCEIDICEPGGGGCVTKTYGDTFLSAVMSDDSENPTCYDVVCGGEATPPAPFLQTSNRKLLINKKQYINSVKKQRITEKIKKNTNYYLNKRKSNEHKKQQLIEKEIIVSQEEIIVSNIKLKNIKLETPEIPEVQAQQVQTPKKSQVRRNTKITRPKGKGGCGCGG